MSKGPDHPSPPDDATFDRLLRDSLPALRAYVRARLGPGLAAHESSSDIVQSVCRELLHERGAFDYQGDTAFRGWLFTAALHKIHQRDRYWRAEKRDIAREAAPHADPADASDLLAGYAHLFTPSRDLSAREQLTHIERALAGLSDPDREIIAMAKIAGLPHSEIAERTGRSEEACRQGLRRALVRLAALLDEGLPL